MVSGIRVNGKFVAYSAKTKSVCIDQGEGEAWWPTSDKVQQFIGKVSKGEVEFEQDESGIVVFINNKGMSQPRGSKQQFGGFNPASMSTNNSIEAQVILKAAIELTKTQMEAVITKGTIINMETEMDNNTRICVNCFKKIKAEI